MSSKVGKTLKLQHTQTFKRGIAALRSTKPTYVAIVCEYADGDVMIENSTDLWKVVKSKDPRAEFETVE